ncbi:MAG: hypothetical protein BJ554DRAFT_6753, partial [Olpidium bornovanus]
RPPAHSPGRGWGAAALGAYLLCCVREECAEAAAPEGRGDRERKKDRVDGETASTSLVSRAAHKGSAVFLSGLVRERIAARDAPRDFWAGGAAALPVRNPAAVLDDPPPGVPPRKRSITTFGCSVDFQNLYATAEHDKNSAVLMPDLSDDVLSLASAYASGTPQVEPLVLPSTEARFRSPAQALDRQRHVFEDRQFFQPGAWDQPRASITPLNDSLQQFSLQDFEDTICEPARLGILRSLYGELGTGGEAQGGFFSLPRGRSRGAREVQLERLAVLEETFLTNTSPNAALREFLAARLNMSERSVQIWFQNRRAKVKKAAKKAQAKQDEEMIKPLLVNSPHMAFYSPLGLHLSMSGSGVGSRQEPHDGPSCANHVGLGLASRSAETADGASVSVFPGTFASRPNGAAMDAPFSGGDLTSPDTPSTWTRVSSDAGELYCGYNPSSQTFQYEILDRGVCFKMELPFANVTRLELLVHPAPSPLLAASQVGTLGSPSIPQSLGQLVLDVVRPPDFFIMQPYAGAAGLRRTPQFRWARCDDFTEGRQATLSSRHVIKGDARMLMAQLDQLCHLCPDVRMILVHHHHLPRHHLAQRYQPRPSDQRRYSLQQTVPMQRRRGVLPALSRQASAPSPLQMHSTPLSGLSVSAPPDGEGLQHLQHQHQHQQHQQQVLYRQQTPLFGGVAAAGRRSSNPGVRHPASPSPLFSAESSPRPAMPCRIAPGVPKTSRAVVSQPGGACTRYRRVRDNFCGRILLDILPPLPLPPPQLPLPSHEIAVPAPWTAESIDGRLVFFFFLLLRVLASYKIPPFRLSPPRALPTLMYYVAGLHG